MFTATGAAGSLRTFSDRCVEVNADAWTTINVLIRITGEVEFVNEIPFLRQRRRVPGLENPGGDDWKCYIITIHQATREILVGCIPNLSWAYTSRVVITVRLHGENVAMGSPSPHKAIGRRRDEGRRIMGMKLNRNSSSCHQALPRVSLPPQDYTFSSLISHLSL